MPTYQLDLSYEEFTKNSRSVADTVIGKYFVYEKLASGAFGSVFRGMDDENKKEVAIKVLDLVSIDRDQGSARVKEIRKRLARTQSELMMKIQSNHVMQLFDVYENKYLKIMAIEFCNGGTLSQQILRRGKIPEKQAIQIVKQIILGISDMHKLNIIHRDLKTDNIMSHNGVYKIVDLGFARMIPADNDIYGTVLGTIITMAPEVMRKQKYGLKADIWSIGIILYEMIYGRLPYEAMKSAEMYQQILKKDIFPNGGKINGVLPSKPIIQLLKKLLTIDHHQRIDWKELVSHECFRNNNKLPDTYRVTVNIHNLEQPKIKQVHEEQIINQIQKNKQPEIQGKNQVKPIRITTKQRDQKKKQIDSTEANIVKWAVANHLQCLKTELILREIIFPIEERKMLSLQERRVVEMIYLLVSRCFLNMSFVLNDFNEEKKSRPNPIVTNLKNTVQTLYKEVCKKFEQYCRRLKDQEDKVFSIIGDRFGKTFKNQDYKVKQKFFTGIESIDFKKEEQILFTEEKYINIIVHEMKNRDVTVIAKLKNYRRINNISTEDLKGKKFFDKVEQIIYEQKSKLMMEEK